MIALPVVCVSRLLDRLLVDCFITTLFNEGNVQQAKLRCD